MNKEINKCDWCQGETNMPNTFTAMSPIQPKMEEQIQKAINKSRKYYTLNWLKKYEQTTILKT